MSKQRNILSLTFFLICHGSQAPTSSVCLCVQRSPAYHLDLDTSRPHSPGPHFTLAARSPTFLVTSLATSHKDAVVEQRISPTISLLDSAWPDFERCACYSLDGNFSHLIQVCTQKAAAIPTVSLSVTKNPNTINTWARKKIFLERINKAFSTRSSQHT